MKAVALRLPPDFASLAAVRRDVVIGVAIVALALAVRATWAVYADRPPQGLNDPLMYDILAHQIAAGNGYTRLTGEPFAYYPVGFPAALGGVYWLLDHTPLPDQYILAGKVMNAILGAATTALVFVLGRRVLGAAAGASAAFLHAVFPGQVFYTGTLLSEPLFTFLLMAGLTALFWDRPRPGEMPWVRLAAGGLLLGAATLTRAITLLLPFALFVFWWWVHRRPRTAAIHAGIVLAGILVFAVPWSIRNTIRLGTPTMISTNAGDDLCIGHHEGATGAFVMTGPCFDDYDYDRMAPLEVEVERDRQGLRRAVRFALTHPLDELTLPWDKLFWLLYTDADGLYATESYGHDPFIPDNLQSALAHWSNLWFFGVMGWALVSAPFLLLSRDPRGAGLLLVAAYVLAIPIVFFGDPRFHYPAVPILTMSAGAGIALVASSARRRALPAPEWMRREPAAAPGVAGG
ncbi:MAG TPA: glycosyltransferase family 39 protein [Dehalococcoidia bacterium]|nr:glycosyltransferase family 39 protein [Dehalococcoidia bacterium]